MCSFNGVGGEKKVMEGIDFGMHFGKDEDASYDG